MASRKKGTSDYVRSRARSRSSKHSAAVAAADKKRDRSASPVQETEHSPVVFLDSKSCLKQVELANVKPAVAKEVDEEEERVSFLESKWEIPLKHFISDGFKRRSIHGASAFTFSLLAYAPKDCLDKLQFKADMIHVIINRGTKAGWNVSELVNKPVRRQHTIWWSDNNLSIDKQVQVAVQKALQETLQPAIDEALKDTLKHST